MLTTTWVIIAIAEVRAHDSLFTNSQPSLDQEYIQSIQENANETTMRYQLTPTGMIIIK